MQTTSNIDAAADALHHIELPDATTNRIYGLLLDYSTTGDSELMGRLLDAVDALAPDYPMEDLRAEVFKISRS